MGLSAMLFTPAIITPSWKRPIAIKAFVPHWAMFNNEWLMERMWKPSATIFRAPGISLSPRGDYVYVCSPMDEEIYGTVKRGFMEIGPFIHMPNDFAPERVWMNSNEGFGHNHTRDINAEWRRATA